MQVKTSPIFSISPLNQKASNKVQFGLSDDKIPDLETMLKEKQDRISNYQWLNSSAGMGLPIVLMSLPILLEAKLLIAGVLSATYLLEKNKIDFDEQPIQEAMRLVSDAIHEGSQVKSSFQQLNTNQTISVFRLHKKSKEGKIFPAIVSNNEGYHKTLKLLTSKPYEFKFFNFRSLFSGAYSLVTQTSDGKNQRHSVSKMGKEAPSQYRYEEIKFDKRDDYPSMTDDATYYYIVMLNPHYPTEWFQHEN